MIKDEQIVSTVKPQGAKLAPKILFEDTHLIILSKPAGLLSQGEHKGEHNLVDWLREYLGRPYVGLVHRLDRNTSGIMVVAKRTKSAQRLTDALQEGRLTRTYRGWVLGHLQSQVRWSHLLDKDRSKNQVRVVTRGGKASALLATPISVTQYQNQTVTLVEFQLETGRSHQIRVQSAWEGYPLLGDQKYQSKTKTRDSQKMPSFPRVALHSFRIEFPHPMSGEVLKFEDPLPLELTLN